MQMSIQYSEELQAFIEKNSGSRGDTSAFRKREERENRNRSPGVAGNGLVEAVKACQSHL